MGSVESRQSPTKADREDSQAPAVDRALDILEALAGKADGLTLTELSAALDLPKNAVFRITRALQSRDYVSRDDVSLRLSLTNKLLRLNQPSGSTKTLVETALPLMRELRDACRETVQIGVRSGLEGVIIEQIEGLHALRISVNIGLRFPLYNNAPGKLLLACLPPAEREMALRQIEFVPCTARTITSREELLKECERITQRGYSTDHAEADEGIHCVAAAVLDRHRELAAALWISGPSRRVPKESFADFGRQVRQTAESISRQLQT